MEDKNYGNRIMVLNFNRDVIPTIKLTKNVNWINFGEDNNYPHYLMDLLNKSPLHNAIVVSKVRSICGKGFYYEKQLDRKTDQFLTSINPNETATDVFEKCAWDYQIFGGFYLNVIWSRDHRSISEIYHVPFNKIRLSKPDSVGRVNAFWYSPNWKEHRKEENKPVLLPAFNTTDDTSYNQIYYYKNYRPDHNFDPYPLPLYIAALKAILIDDEIYNCHLSNIMHGMQPGSIITFTNGEPSEDEKRTIERQLSLKFEGSDNRGKSMLLFADNKDAAPIITTFTTQDIDKQFIQLQETAMSAILAGHRITSPMLVGIKTPGQLGGGDEVKHSWQIYNNQVIKPETLTMLKPFNMFGKINGLCELLIKENDVFEFEFSEEIMKEIFTINELRNKIDEPPIPNGNKFIKEIASVKETEPEPIVEKTLPTDNIVQ